MQVFQVLRCYKCEVFQVHLVKKSNKWKCKMCGEKQSMKRHYGLGNAKKCREHVQKLNNMRGEASADEIKSIESEEDTDGEEINVPIVYKPKTNLKRSKWNDFIEETEPQSSENNYSGSEVVLNAPKRPRKKCEIEYKLKQNCDIQPIEEINNVSFKQKNKYNTNDILNAINELEGQRNTVKCNKPHQLFKWSTFVEEEFDNEDNSQGSESHNENNLSLPESFKWNTFVDDEEISEKENYNVKCEPKSLSLQKLSKWNAFVNEEDTFNVTNRLQDVGKYSGQNIPDSITSQISWTENGCTKVQTNCQFVVEEAISSNKELEVQKASRLPMFEDEDFDY